MQSAKAMNLPTHIGGFSGTVCSLSRSVFHGKKYASVFALVPSKQICISVIELKMKFESHMSFNQYVCSSE